MFLVALVILRTGIQVLVNTSVSYSILQWVCDLLLTPLPSTGGTDVGADGAVHRNCETEED